MTDRPTVRHRVMTLHEARRAGKFDAPVKWSNVAAPVERPEVK